MQSTKQPRQRESARQQLPSWFKIRPPTSEGFATIKGLVKKTGLATVCAEAHCPNLAECWSGGTATFMLLGETCTRGCGFCAVKTGNPRGALDPFEPLKLAESVRALGLDYVVITMVARDDLPDGGAAHIAKAIRAVKMRNPQTRVEVLISDLRGRTDALQIVIDAAPVVLAHNIETVERLTPYVRDGRARYRQSLALLQKAKTLISPDAPMSSDVSVALYTKSSIMLGLGETEDEVVQTMRDLRGVQVDFLTLGQYLQPSKQHLALQEYIHPDQFKKLETVAYELGFFSVASGPLVRSSYRAGEYFKKL